MDDKGGPLLVDFGCSLFMDVNTLEFFPSPHHKYSGSIRWMPGEKMCPGQHPLTLKADSYTFAYLCLEVSVRGRLRIIAEPAVGFHWTTTVQSSQE
jgi:hypothetical protein